MATLHGSWISGANEGYFFLWGEMWRSRSGIASPTIDPATAASHPFCLNDSELRASTKTLGIAIAPSNEAWRQQRVVLPTQMASDGMPLLPLLSAKMHAERDANLALHPWLVSGWQLPPQQAIALLAALPPRTWTGEEQTISNDLYIWRNIYRWGLDLLARSKFLPTLAIAQPGAGKSRWEPLLDNSSDLNRWQEFSRYLPEATRAYSDPPPNAEALVLDFLNAILDVQIRRETSAKIPPVTNAAVKHWLQSLAKPSGWFESEPAALERLEKAIATWIIPIRESLGSECWQRSGGDRFRTCLHLRPPASEESDWTLAYYLQAIDDERYTIPAEIVWRSPGEQLVYRGRAVAYPQETLLKGLGLAARLYEAIATSLETPAPVACQLDPIQAYMFVKASAWELQDKGLGVQLPPGLAPGAGEKRLGVKAIAELPPGRDRLNLQTLLHYRCELAVGDYTLSPAEFERLLSQQSPLVEVKGEWMALQPADVRSAQELLASKNGEMSLTLGDALRLYAGEMQTANKLPVVDFEVSGELKELFASFTDNQALSRIEQPPELRGELRPYQQMGASWIAFLERWGMGACLADDMGLGKSVQTIAFLLHLKERGDLETPVLLICPTSVLGNWEKEVQKFAPSLATLVHHGDKRLKGNTFAKGVANYHIIIASYAIAQRDEKTLQGVSWRGIILDEAQNIKNPRAKQSQAVRNVAAGFRLALTGTPVENRLSELWSILDFLNPGYLGSQQFFQRRFATPIEKHGDRDSLQTLRSLVRPFILRRLKTDRDIVPDLPEKQEANVYCGLSGEQADLYQQLVDAELAAIASVEGIQRHGKVLTLLMRLKQLCNHPALFLKEKNLQRAERSGKLVRLSEMLEEIVTQGDRALIFTQFAEWGKLLKPYLEVQFGGEIPFLYGATRKQQREEMVDRFQNDPQGARIFILSIKAGGTGLNLTRANHVFHVDRWWNPAVENQATDRAFRLGQVRNVQVHKFVCTGTLEERIDALINSKKQLAEQAVDAGEDWLTDLDTEQLRDLVALERRAIVDEE